MKTQTAIKVCFFLCCVCMLSVSASKSHTVISDTDVDSQTQLAEKRRPLHLFFNLDYDNVNDGGHIMEFDWISQIVFGKVGRELYIHSIKDVGYTTEIESLKGQDVVTVGFTVPNALLPDMLNESRPNVIGMYHMGDEKIRANYSWCLTADLIFRNYYSAKLLSTVPKLRYIPIGMKTGFFPIVQETLVRASKRQINCNFIGSLRGDRLTMIQEIKNHSALHCYLHYKMAWASRQGLSPIKYRQILTQSTFTFAPHGNNPESMRIWEAMEAGSIPVYTLWDKADLEFNSIFKPPYVVAKTWKKATATVAALLGNPAQLDQMQQDVKLFWKEYKDNIQEGVRADVNKAFVRRYGYGY